MPQAKWVEVPCIETYRNNTSITATVPVICPYLWEQHPINTKLLQPQCFRLKSGCIVLDLIEVVKAFQAFQIMSQATCFFTVLYCIDYTRLPRAFCLSALGTRRETSKLQYSFVSTEVSPSTELVQRKAFSTFQNFMLMLQRRWWKSDTSEVRWKKKGNIEYRGTYYPSVI
jgi:hypothetical protein